MQNKKIVLKFSFILLSFLSLDVVYAVNGGSNGYSEIVKPDPQPDNYPYQETEKTYFPNPDENNQSDPDYNEGSSDSNIDSWKPYPSGWQVIQYYRLSSFNRDLSWNRRHEPGATKPENFKKIRDEEYKEVTAMRVSIYNKNAQKIGNSVDFYYATGSCNNVPIYVYTTKDRLSKLEYLTYYKSGINKVAFLNNTNMVLNYKFKNHIFNTFNESIFEDAVGITDESSFRELFQNAESNFLANTGITFDQIFANPTEYYLILEPATILECQAQQLFLTYFEYEAGTLKLADLTGLTQHPLCTSDFSLGMLDLNSGYNKYKNSNINLLGRSSVLNPEQSTGHNNDPLANILKELSNKSTSEEQYVADNKYGIAVLWFGSLGPSCGPNDSNYYDDNGRNGCCATGLTYNYNTHTCADPVPSPEPEPTECKAYCKANACENVIDCTYTNCPYLDEENNQKKYDYTVEYSDTNQKEVTLCQINCTERYFVKSRFITLNKFNIVAGQYFPVNIPEAFHKKTCAYQKVQEEKIDNYVNITKNNCESHCILEYDENNVPTNLDEYNLCKGACQIQAESDRRDIRNGCTDINNTYNKLKDKIVDTASSDVLGDLTLTLNDFNTNYNLNAYRDESKVQYGTDENGINGTKYDYGYHNTFSYYIDLNSNRHICVGNHCAYFKYGQATTPITTKVGQYTFNVNYTNLFSNNFKTVMKDFGNVDVSSFNQIDGTASGNETQCTYNIVERNIKKKCIPTSANNYCEQAFERSNIRMVYRPVNLSFPFPGKSGQGRTAGINWSDTSIKNYITENRGVNTEEIYSKEPLYIIKLDAKNINEIREYNKEHAYDDFTLVCSDPTKSLNNNTSIKECKSPFLREYGLITGGKCQQMDSVADFYNCIHDN